MLAQIQMGKFIYRAATPTTDTGTAGIMDANGDIVIVSVEDLANISLFVNQIVDAGTCTIVMEKTVDGTNWASVAANLSEASFPAGNNTAKETTLSDSNGMALGAKQLRITLSAVAGGGTYTAGATGTQRWGYR